MLWFGRPCRVGVAVRDAYGLLAVVELAQSAAEDRAAVDVVADGGFVLLVIALALVVGRVAGVVARRIIGSVAKRSLLGANSSWRVRVPRLVAESVPVAELRRDHRVGAAATMVTRLVKIVIWLVAAVVVLDHLEVDLILAVSGAGFLGAAIAIGGQNSVHDYLNGLHVLLEDRFGEGDSVRIMLDGGGEHIDGTVTRVGAFATRIETEQGTFHLANRRAHQVMNLSQREFPRLFELDGIDPSTSGVDLATEVAATLSAVSDETLGGARLGFVIDAVESVDRRRGRSSVRVNARFSRALTDDELARLVEAATGRLDSR